MGLGEPCARDATLGYKIDNLLLQLEYGRRRRSGGNGSGGRWCERGRFRRRDSGNGSLWRRYLFWCDGPLGFLSATAAGGGFRL